MRHIILILLVGLHCATGYAQGLQSSVRPHNKTILNAKQGQFNYTTFRGAVQHPQPTGQLARYVSAATRKHPEYGTLAFQAPCDNCVELLDKRTETQREFMLLDKPGEVILQAANGPLHYQDAQGFWRTIDHHLQPVSPGVFAATKQPFPVQVNLNEGTAHIGRAGQPGITISKAMRTYVYDRPAETARVANLTSLDYTAGADGVRQHHILPNTYRELTVGRGKIKSSVVLQKPPVNLPATGIWVLEETYELPDGYMARIDEASGTPVERWYNAEILIENAMGHELGRIHRPAIWDSGDHSQDRAHLYDLKQMALQNVAYEVLQEGRLLHVRILVDAYWLQHPSTVYPITIDPEVELTQSNLTTGGFSRGAKCTGAAASSINFTIPGGYSPISMDVDSVIYFSTGLTCGLGMSNSCVTYMAGVDIITPCTTFPDVYCDELPSVAGECFLFGYNLDDAINCVTPANCNPYPVVINFANRNFTNCGAASCGTTCHRLEIGRSTINIRARTVWAIVYYEDPTGQLTTDIPTVCVGGSVTLRGGILGVQPYTHEWSVGGNVVSTQATYTFSPVANTLVTHRILSDACAYDDTQTFNVLIAPTLTATVAKTDVNCTGPNTGTITLSSPAGAPGNQYDYSINGGTTWGTSASFTGLSAGNYHVMIRDRARPLTCAITLNPALVINPAVPLSATVTKTDITCFGAGNGTITISGQAGGSGNYQYSTNGGGTWGSSASFTGLGFGGYNVQMRDANFPSCVLVLNASLTINQPAQLNATVTLTQPTCHNVNDGAIAITAPTGGGGTYQYSINGGSTWASTASFTGLAAGVYDIRIRDAATPTCARTLNATAALNNPTQLNATLGKTDPTTCAAPHNGSITLTAPAGGSGLYDFSIDGGANWSTSATFTGLAAGNYDVRIRDRNNPTCVRTLNAAYTLAGTPPLAATAAGTNPTTCAPPHNGQIAITGVSGGGGTYEYSINGGSTWANTATFTGLAAGSYDVRVRDAASILCVLTVNANLSLTAPGSVNATLASTNPTTCTAPHNGSITISAPTGGGGTYEYSINGGTIWVSSGAFTGLAPTTYNVQVRDAANPSCSAILNAALTLVPPTPVSGTVASTNPATCGAPFTGSITISAPTGGAGTYEYSINGGSAWSGSGTFSGLAAGTYDVRIRDAANPACNATLDAARVLTVVTPLSADVSTSPLTCPDNTSGTIQFSNTVGAASYEYSIDGGTNWSTTATFNTLAAGTYALRIRDAGTQTCVADLGTRTLAPLQFANAGTNGSVCADEASYTPAGFSPVGGSWSSPDLAIDATTGTVVVSSASAPGTYTLTYQVAGFCDATQELTIHEVPAVDFVSSVLLNVPQNFGGDFPVTLTVTNPEPGNTYIYDFGNGQTLGPTSSVSETFVYRQAGDYTLRVTAQNAVQCRATATQATLQLRGGTFNIFNVVTPNADGHNDTWRIEAPGYADMAVRVYNRWGIEVFTQQAMGLAGVLEWRPDVAGTEVPEGQYFYEFSAKDPQGNPIRLAGFVTVIR